MSQLLNTLIQTNLVDLPTRYVTALTSNRDIDQIILMVVRALVIGGLVAGARRGCAALYKKVIAYLVPRVYIHNSDAAFLWVSPQVNGEQSVKRERIPSELSLASGKRSRTSASRTLLGLMIASLDRYCQPIAPPVRRGQSYQLWIEQKYQDIRLTFKGRSIWVTRRMTYFARSAYRTADHLQIKTYTWNRELLKDFLVAAHGSYFAKEDQELMIFHPRRTQPGWQRGVSRPSRPWASVILPGTVKASILQDVERFLSEKEIKWYGARGIPHRRGYLLHGDRGQTYIYTNPKQFTAVASKLRLDIYILDPAQRGMDDAKLGKLIRDCPARSVILIEDIDCIMPLNRNQASSQTLAHHPSPSVGDSGYEPLDEVGEEGPANAGNHQKESTPDTPSRGKHDLAPSIVTLSGLLNAIDGVSSQEGCLLIASTNHPDRLDPALRRPGRFDFNVAFTSAEPSQAKALFLHFYPAEDFVGHGTSVAVTAKNPTALDVGTTAVTHTLSEKVNVVNKAADIEELADQFVEVIFPGGIRTRAGGQEGKTISMAFDQGFLLGYKDDPLGAVSAVKAWIEGPSILGIGVPAGGAGGIATAKTKKMKKATVALTKGTIENSRLNGQLPPTPTSPSGKTEAETKVKME